MTTRKLAVVSTEDTARQVHWVAAEKAGLILIGEAFGWPLFRASDKAQWNYYRSLLKQYGH